MRDLGSSVGASYVKFWRAHFLKKKKTIIKKTTTKKTRAEISRRMHRSMGRDLSYETDSGPKTKTVKVIEVRNS